MNYISRVRTVDDTEETFSEQRVSSASLYKSIYFKLKKIALEVVQSYTEDFEKHTEGRDRDLVKKLIIYCFKLAKRAHVCPQASKKFLKIVKMLPNRLRLLRMLQKLKSRKVEDGSLILCMIKFQELRCEILDSGLHKVSRSPH
jgi:hypothetical protein